MYLTHPVDCPEVQKLLDGGIKDNNMREITLEELLEAGCHFGHQVNRSNPKAHEFIFEARNNVHIINLEATRDGLLTALDFVKKLASENGSMVVVGTKRQIREIIKEEVEKVRKEGASNIHFVTTRWIGGVLTNFHEVSKNFKRLNEIEEILSEKDSGYTKREKLLMEREREKLLDLYEGIRDMKSIPDALFIVDTHHEATAVSEARRLNVTTVGVVDTNADPGDVDYAIPSNDDAVGAVKLLVSVAMEAWAEGQKKKENTNSEMKKEAKPTKVTADEAQAGSKESVAVNEIAENTEKKEATKRAATKSEGAKPAVKNENREKAGKQSRVSSRQPAKQ